MTSTLDHAMDEVHILLSGDGLRFEVVDGHLDQHALRLRLNLDAVECADCIMPVDYLTSLVQETLQQALSDPALSLTIDDPRTSTDEV